MCGGSGWPGIHVGVRSNRIIDRFATWNSYRPVTAVWTLAEIRAANAAGTNGVVRLTRQSLSVTSLCLRIISSNLSCSGYPVETA